MDETEFSTAADSQPQCEELGAGVFCYFDKNQFKIEPAEHKRLARDITHEFPL